MTVDVKVPVLAESIPDATLLEWRKREGDAVAENEILIELETDKVVLEVPAPTSGLLGEILKQTGETVTSEEVLARIEPDGGAAAKASPAPAPASAAAPSAAARPLSPAVRRLVEEHDLDPTRIEGTGRDGRLTKADVLAYVEEQGASAPAPAESAAPDAAPAPASDAAPPPAPAPRPAPAARPAPAPAAAGARGERREAMSRLRQRIAERLVEAQHGAAILTTFNEVDMGPASALRRRYRDAFEKKHAVRLGFMSFFVKAAVQALERFPAVNAYVDGNEIVYHDFCDVGVAVGSPRGLVVPILRNAERMSFPDIEAAIAEFGVKARDGTLTIDDMSGGTFTISNGGVFGSLLSTPILNPPQSAILGMHKIEDRPVVVDGEIVVRPMMYLALSYDHRIVDGREAVQFLVTIKEAVEDPARLLLDV